MVNTPTYSNILHCIHDEPGETGNIGRGSHYSVFRVPEWFDVTGKPVKKAMQHDFSVIWDEDHDTRIIPVIENLYLAGLLFPLQFIGERKGGVTAILAAKFCFAHSQEDFEDYKSKFEKIAGQVDEDWWSTEFGMFDRSIDSPHQTDLSYLVGDRDARKVDTYVRNIDNLWNIGSWRKMKSSTGPTAHDLI